MLQFAQQHGRITRPLRRFVLLMLGSAIVGSATAAPPDFGRDIRPILSDHCYACHGPDAPNRQASLRLDTAEGLSDVVVAGDPDASELLARIESTDSDSVMPPVDSHKPLSEAQKTQLRAWIAAGGTFEQHWAFVPPQPSEPPRAGAGDATGPIDAFIHASAREQGLPLSPPADPYTLLRRVSFSLTGLPPTEAMRNEFLNDPSPMAYERLVDQLLQSPQFGEHWGRIWLDLVRYADTHGLHLDNYREMWLYRDWVIEAFNENRPHDTFIIEQLAGDLLENATTSQQIASGYNRLNVTTSEGGSIYEEVFARNVIDRTDAFGTVFMGLTTRCAVCHDHKFDPILMREYYSLAAYFNSLDGSAMDGNVKDHPPSLRVPTPENLEQIRDNEAMLASIRASMEGPLASVDQAQQAWERLIASGQPSQTHTLVPLSVRSESGVKSRVREDQSIEILGDAAAKDSLEIVASIPAGAAWQTLRLEALTETPDGRVGASPNGNAVLSEIVVESTDALANGEWLGVPIRYAFADIEQNGEGFSVRRAIDGAIDANQGWAVAGHQQIGPRTAWFGISPLVADAEDSQIRIRLHFASQFAQHQFRRVRLSLSDGLPAVPEDQRITLGDWHSLGPLPIENSAAGYDRPFASQQKAFQADEVFRYEDRDYRWQHRGDLHEVEAHDVPVIEGRASVTLVHRAIEAPSAQEVTLLLGSDDGHVVYLNGQQVGLARGPRAHRPLAEQYVLPLKQGGNDLYVKYINHEHDQRSTIAFRAPAIEVPAQLAELVKIPEAERSDENRQSLRKYYRSVHALHPDWLALVDMEAGLVKDRQRIDAEIPTTLVWKELPQPREARLLLRGQYDQPGEVVPRETPAFLPPMPEDAPNDRLGLAQWLVSDEHPLTARVAVNRFWQQVFGTGLVKTSEDFGSQGESPSHPELLDWLAIDFRQHGWDVKRLLKSLVMTETFRRSSVTDETSRGLDPENRFLARGPRYRLDAEVLRDQVLSVSGLLVQRLGGPSVRPPQPAGLWEAVGYTRSNTATFKADEGEAIYRRSVYTFWKRTSPPPQMTTFDAPSRESCTVRRERTNTPLQALLMLNEPQYLQAARELATDALNTSELASDDQRLAWLFERITMRPPNDEQHQELQQLLRDLTAYYATQPELAEKLVGQPSPPLAAWTVTANTLLNLDLVVCN